MIKNVYFVKPLSGSGKGVLALHAWWGLNAFMRGFCDRLAGEGFTVLAPDLYHGAIANTIPEAEKLRSKLKRQAASQAIHQAAERLRQETGEGQEGIGVVGFSLGGYWALWLAEQPASAVLATVVFYGTRSGDYRESRSAFQVHLAESDPYVSASGVKALHKCLKAAGRTAEFHSYPGTSHWFFEDDRTDAYQNEAADLAWKRTHEFLQGSLK